MLRAAPALVPLQINANLNAINQLKADAAIRGTSLIELDVLDIESDNDFLVSINASLHRLRLSDLLGNLDDRGLSHVFFVSSLHRIEESLGSRFLTVAQAFAGTSVRFCVLLPEPEIEVELRIVRKVLDEADELLCLRLVDQGLYAHAARENVLIERFKALETSLHRLDERAKSLESRGRQLRNSIDVLNVHGFIESLQPSTVLRERIESRLESTAERSISITAQVSVYK